MATQNEINAQIDQIVTGGDYTAVELRLLLGNILGSLYSPFFNAASIPSTSSNQTANYKANSFGKNSSTGRFFVCSNATASTATWEQVSIDRGYQSISAVASTAYQLSSNTSIVNFSGSQSSVTVNLPTAVNSYEGKVIKVFFSSPAQTSGLGVTFVLPGVVPATILAANIYTSNAVVQFTFVGSTWIVTQNNATVVDVGIQTAFPVNAGTATVLADATFLNLNAILATTYASYNVILPDNPYSGKIIKIQTNNNATITLLNVKKSDGTTIASGALAINQGVEFVHVSNNTWLKVAPTIIW